MSPVAVQVVVFLSPIWPITDRQRHQFLPEAICLQNMQTQLSCIASRSNIQGSNWLFPTSQIQYKFTLRPFLTRLDLRTSHSDCESYIASHQGRIYREPGFSVDCDYSKRPGTPRIYQSSFHNSMESFKRKKLTQCQKHHIHQRSSSTKPNKTTTKMGLPIRTITSFKATYNPFSRLSRPCSVFLSLLRTPSTTSMSSPNFIDMKIKQLPRHSTELPEMTVGFKNGQEIRLEVGKRKMSVGDVCEEVARVGRVIEREQTLND